jgi:hypothetical protein
MKAFLLGFRISLALKFKHINLAELGNNFFRFIALLTHRLFLLLGAKTYISGRTTFQGEDQYG